MTARRGTLLAGLLCVVAASAAAGPRGSWGALLGAALVVGFFSSGALPILLVGPTGTRAGLGLIVLLLSYTLRLALVLLVLRLVAALDVLDTRWLGATVVVCALAWSGLHVAMVVRAGDSR